MDGVVTKVGDGVSGPDAVDTHKPDIVQESSEETRDLQLELGNSTAIEQGYGQSGKPGPVRTHLI